MKIAIVLFVLFLVSGFSFGHVQAEVLRGFVTNAETREKLPGVNVQVLTIKNVGAATNAEGEYILTALPPGNYTVRFSLVGYEILTVNAVVDPTKETILNVSLMESSVSMDEITVTAQNKSHVEDIRSSFMDMKPAEVKQLAGGAEDVLRSLKSLPGVSGISDLSARYTVRGSNPESNLILIDGFEVLNPYRLYGFTSMYNPETVSDITLHTGGFNAEYGDRIASVLSVTSRNGDKTRPVGGRINTSLTNMNLILEGKLPLLEDASYLVSARRTYYDMIVGPMLKSSKVFEGDVALPSFRDVQAKIVAPVNNSQAIQLNLLFSEDGMNLTSSAERKKIDSVRAKDKSQNTLIGLTHSFTPDENLYLETKASYHKNNGTGTMNMSMTDPARYNETPGRLDTLGIRLMSWDSDYDYRYTKTSISQTLTWKSWNHSAEIGYGIDALRADITNHIVLNADFAEHLRSRGESIPTSITESMSYNKYNFFLSDAVTLGNLSVKAGLRIDAYPALQKEMLVSPRLNIRYKLNEVSSLRAAYGEYFQSLGMDKQNMTSRISYTKSNLKNLVPESADHLILGYERMVDDKWQFTTEGYYKTLSNIIAPAKYNVAGPAAERVGSNPRMNESWRITDGRYDSLTNVPLNGAKGEAYGIELMLKKTNNGDDDKLSAWISYALSYAERERDGKRSPLPYDQRHAVNIAGDYIFSDSWTIGFKFTLRSGRPYAKALGVQPRIVTLTEGGASHRTIQVDQSGNAVLDVNYEKDAYDGRLNTYHSLDLRVTNYRTWFGLDWSFYLDIQNTYNRENEEQVNYYINGTGDLVEKYIYGLPILPSVGFSVTF